MQEQDFEPTADELEQREAAALEARKAALAAIVARRKTEAVNARQASGIEQIWREDEDQYNGFDSLNPPVKNPAGIPIQQTGATPRKGRSTVFLNITQPKTDAAEARVCEMLLPVDDKPWAIGPTPVPELLDAVDGQDDTPVTLADGAQVPARLVAQTVMDKAQTAADEHGKWIEDHFIEGKVYAELRKVIKGAARVGTGILKGPTPVMRTDKRWRTVDGITVLEMVERIAPTSKEVSPWDFFPAPDCGDCIHDGSYVFERDYMTARQLRKLAADPSYDRAGVLEAVKDGPRKAARADRRDDRDYPGEVNVNDSDVFEVWYYHGDVPVEDLQALGLDDLPEGLTHVAAIVTTVNDRIIKAALNPLDTGDFPYDVFAWEPMPGQPWGRGVPRKMAVAQRMLNAATRAMLENAGLSAGPQVVIREGVVQPADGRYEITGRKLWKFIGDDTINDVRQAMQVFEIGSAQQELHAIIQFALQMADETAALPLLIQGQQGPAPDTVGGMTLLMNNSSSMLRRVAKQFDDQIIVPHLSRWYDFGMQHGPEAIKGDLQVKAKGSSTLVQRDQSNQFLMQSAAMVGNPAFRINPEKWFVEVCKANHFDPAAIQFTEAEMQQQAQQQGQPQQQDPRIVAAELRNQAVQIKVQADQQESAADREFEAQDRAAQREHERIVKEIEREIQVMEFAGRREISLDQIKAMLASKAADNQTKRELFQQERALKIATGQGI